jgi:A/G-specific adenine glycosylase
LSSEIASKLLDWYDHNARVLPWRSDPQPYHVWVSEMMLQQTQVETVVPYYQRFIQRFPDIPSLAQASQAEVLQAWEGLGYYSRARSLHRAAGEICARYNGQLPCEAAQLQKLPGVGPYIAAAIASIACNQPEPALDGNLRRVFTRLLNLSEAIGTPASEHLLRQFALEQIPHDRPGDFNQALMDLGALVCRPKTPACPLCPLAESCLAFKTGTQASLPVRKSRPPVPHWVVTAAIIQAEGRVLIAQRPPSGLLGGLWEFPGGKLEDSDGSLAEGLQREIQEELGLKIIVGTAFGVYCHAYTHFRITLHAFLCVPAAGEQLDSAAHPEARWVLLQQLTDFPMGKVDRLIARRLQAAPDLSAFQPNI